MNWGWTGEAFLFSLDLRRQGHASGRVTEMVEVYPVKLPVSLVLLPVHHYKFLATKYDVEEANGVLAFTEPHSLDTQATQINYSPS